MTISAFIKHIEQELFKRYQDPILCQQYAWWMVEEITKKDKAQLLTHQEYILTDDQKKQLQEWIDKQITEHVPLQYLLGSVPFNDIAILVEPPTLIPRPETEEWSLALISQLQKARISKLRILDLCTGSGCVALALAKALPQSTIVGTDIADTALALAQKNKQHNAITNVEFKKSDLFEQLQNEQPFDLIVSNPPYIDPIEWQTLDDSVKKWEDKHALVAQEQGLALIHEIIKRAPNYLRCNSQLTQAQIPQVWIEIGYNQGISATLSMKKHNYFNVAIKEDMEKKDRVVVGSVFDANCSKRTI